MNKITSPHEASEKYHKKLARDKWANDKQRKNQSVADQILKQATQGFSQKHYPQPPQIASDDLMKRITALQAAGHITNAKMTRQPGSPDTSMVIEFTMAGLDAIILRDTPEMLDTEFLEDQIAEYQDEIPKAFLDGLKAAEGILRGTDYLENYIESK